MSNVSTPSGPLNPNPNPRLSESAKPGSDRFQEIMKVDSSTEGKGKKRKRREEDDPVAVAKALSQKQKEHVKNTHQSYKIKTREGQKRQPKHERRSEEVMSSSEEQILQAPPSNDKRQVPKPKEKDPDEEVPSSLPPEKPFVSVPLIEQTAEQEEEILLEEVSQGDLHNSKEDFSKREEPKPSKPAPTANAAPHTPTLTPSFLLPTTDIPPAYTSLPPQILALFEKMVSVMTIIADSGVKETVIHLDSAEFVSSVFKGSRIVIREYSTAPLAYNIELIGTPEAVSYFQKNLPQLQASFKDRHYRFRVNRLEAGLSQDAISIVERKKPVGDSEEE